MNIKHSYANRGRRIAAFTLVEIALCLAVIGFALVAIIGVLPIGMSVQKDNREQTIINFDANYLMSAIRSGAQGQDTLTNYIYSITVNTTAITSNGIPQPPVPAFTYVFTTSNTFVNGSPVPLLFLTNGLNIVALLSTPKYALKQPFVFVPLPPSPPNMLWSNNVSADFRAITGSMVDQGISQTSKDFAFAYRVTVENVPSGEFPLAIAGNFSSPLNDVLASTNTVSLAQWANFNQYVQDNLHEFRLQFRWPILPNGTTGLGNQVYRTTASGTMTPAVAFGAIPAERVLQHELQTYLISPQTYTNLPP